MKGAYLLFIKLEKDERIKIGKLGSFDFKKGFYVYSGSALKNLEARVKRHAQKKKKFFWHIDYLLNSKKAKIVSILAIESKKRIECKLNKIVSSLPGAKFLVKKFGSSDCKCKSHLVYFSEINIANLIKNQLKLELS
ncbi:MAG: GIY-YIG nuclease family protein [Candidatus Aenigmatarchaeota archaeon]